MIDVGEIKIYMARILEAFLTFYRSNNWLIYGFGENIYTNHTENIFKLVSQNNSSSVSSSIIRSYPCLTANSLLYFLINYKKKKESYSALIVEGILNSFLTIRSFKISFSSSLTSLSSPKERKV